MNPNRTILDSDSVSTYTATSASRSPRRQRKPDCLDHGDDGDDGAQPLSAVRADKWVMPATITTASHQQGVSMRKQALLPSGNASVETETFISNLGGVESSTMSGTGLFSMAKTTSPLTRESYARPVEEAIPAPPSNASTKTATTTTITTMPLAGIQITAPYNRELSFLSTTTTTTPRGLRTSKLAPPPPLAVAQTNGTTTLSFPREGTGVEPESNCGVHGIMMVAADEPSIAVQHSDRIPATTIASGTLAATTFPSEEVPTRADLRMSGSLLAVSYGDKNPNGSTPSQRTLDPSRNSWNASSSSAAGVAVTTTAKQSMLREWRSSATQAAKPSNVILAAGSTSRNNSVVGAVRVQGSRLHSAGTSSSPELTRLSDDDWPDHHGEHRHGDHDDATTFGTVPIFYPAELVEATSVAASLEEDRYDLEATSSIFEESLYSARQPSSSEAVSSGYGLPNAHVSSNVGSEVMPAVVATKDSFAAHVKTNRKTQLLLLCFVLVMIGLGVALGIALTSGGSDSAPPPAPPQDTYVVYQQVGESLYGSSNSNFGRSVSTCGSGARVAVAAPAAAVDMSFVRVYDLMPRANTSSDLDANATKFQWIQVGQDINVVAGSNTLLSGASVVVRSSVAIALSPDCNAVVIGCPFFNNTGRVDIFRYNSSTKEGWIPIGDPILGEHPDDLFGASVAVGQFGDVVVVGIPGSDNAVGTSNQTTTYSVDAGRVRVFQINSGQWIALGEPIDGTNAGQNAGSSVDLSADGRVVAFGMSTKRTDDEQHGARVFDFRTGAWTERGSGTPVVNATYDTAWFVRISAEGDVIVSSNYYLDKNGLGNVQANDALYFEAYQYDSTNNVWIKLGDNMHRSSPGSKSGYVIDLSDDGYRVAMGDPGVSTADGAVAGHAHLYEYQADVNAWCQVGPNKNGENAGDAFGYSVALSGNGTRMIMGAPYSRYLGPTDGCAQVFDIDPEDRVQPICPH